MEPIRIVNGRAYPLGLKNVDTDVIIPANYLKTITRAGLGKGAFEAIRAEPGNVFDDPAYAGLLAGGSVPNAQGNLEFDLAGAALIAPRPDIAPNAYEFRGPVVSLTELTDWIVPDAAIARVTVMRPFEDEDGQPDAEGLDLPILLRRATLEAEDWPAPGDEVEGIIFVYGSGFAAPFDDDDGEDAGGADGDVPILR